MKKTHAPSSMENVIKMISKNEIILIAGGTASGKTTFAKRLHEFYGDKALLLSMDSYYFGREFSLRHKLNFDQPESVDIKKLVENLKELREGQPTEVPIYSFKEDGGKRIGYKTVYPKEITIVEGLFAFHKDLLPYGTLKIFVETDTHGRLIRRLLRDTLRTVWPAEQTFKYFFVISENMYNIYISPQKKYADIVVLNPHNPRKELPLIGVCEIETQMKVLEIPSPESLSRLGAKHINSLEYEDSYFKIPSRHSHKKETIRIRRNGLMHTFTYKGPDIGGEVRTKNKFEFPISLQSKKEIEPYLILEKELRITRKTFMLNKIFFSVDHVSYKGEEQHFLEVRGAKGAELEALLEKLGLKHAYRTNLSYYQIFK
ncbi:MAG: CYTH domain-containing protein [Candidatus Paceibacterota bacterium]